VRKHWGGYDGGYRWGSASGVCQLEPPLDAVEAILDVLQTRLVGGQDLQDCCLGLLDLSHVVAQRIHSSTNGAQMLQDKVFGFAGHAANVAPVGALGKGAVIGGPLTCR